MRKSNVGNVKGTRDWKCLEALRGGNACNGCLAHTQKRAGNSPGKSNGRSTTVNTEIK